MHSHMLSPFSVRRTVCDSRCDNCDVIQVNDFRRV